MIVDANKSRIEGSILIFTKSKETTIKLSNLLNHIYGSTISGALTSETPNRPALLQSFTKGDIKVLVASDLACRGLDLSIDCVVQYNIPPHLSTYVHRVGRTARANKEGESLILLEKKEVKFFKAEMKRLERSQTLKKVELKSEELEELKLKIATSLAVLGIQSNEEAES